MKMSSNPSYWGLLASFSSVIYGFTAGYGTYKFFAPYGNIAFQAGGVAFGIFFFLTVTFGMASWYGLFENQKEDKEWFEAELKKG